MIYDDKLRKLLSIAYFNNQMRTVGSIYRACRDGVFKLVWMKVEDDYILMTPEALAWLDSELGKEYLLEIRSNRDWNLIEFEELL